MATASRVPLGTAAGLAALAAMSAVLIGVIGAFSRQILRGLPDAGDVSATVLVIIAIGLPVALLGIVVFQVVRLARQRAARRPGARLKSRLVLFFAAVALMAAVPTAVISVTFINTGVDLWLGSDVGTALQDAESTLLRYYRGSIEGLRSTAGSQLFAEAAAAGDDAEQLWRRINEVNPGVTSVQFFELDGILSDAAGDPLPVATYRPPSMNTGVLPRDDRGPTTILRYGQRVGERYVVLATALPRGFFGRASVTEALATFTQLDRFRGVLRLVIVGFYLLLAFPVVLAAILVSFLLTEELTQPVANLAEATKRVAEGDFSFRVLARSDDELAVLVDSFNRMIAELAASRRKLVFAEKVATWRDIAQRLAHEIKNPLTPIKLSAERILKTARESPARTPAVVEPAVASIVGEVENLNKLLVEFREFARLPDPTPQPIRPRELVEEVVHLYASWSALTVEIDQVDGSHEVFADRDQLKQVVGNLTKNAVQAMPRGGRLSYRTDIVQKADKSFWRLQIADTGIGIDRDVIGDVFQPYVTTKRHGTGLGLAIVERVIFDHNGSIWYESEPGRGTTFMVDLPIEVP